MSKGKWSARMRFVFQASGTAWSPSVEKEAKHLVADAVALTPEAALKSDADALLMALGSALEGKLEAAKVRH